MALTLSSGTQPPLAPALPGEFECSLVPCQNVMIGWTVSRASSWSIVDLALSRPRPQLTLNLHSAH